MSQNPKGEISLQNHSIFFDRELSWLEFNFRVLEESEDLSNPILERLKFLCITESNLDEFYMVRVAGLRELVNLGREEKSLNGMKTGEILSSISEYVKKMLEKQSQILQSQILPELKKSHIHLIQDVEDLLEGDIPFLKIFYKEEVSGILTPLAIDTSHPFPHILNRSLNLAITLTDDKDKLGKIHFAVVQVPSVLPRFVELPANGFGDRRFFPLEKIIDLHLSDLFYGMTVKEIAAFKITRDSDISIREDQTADLLSSVKNELKNRIWGEAVKLDVSENASSYIKSTLRDLLGLHDYEVFESARLIHISDLMFFYSLPDTSHLKFPPLKFKNQLSVYNLDRVFEQIQKSDILFHHPYDSFEAVENLLKYASQDPKVLGIKMTLYRTSGDSPIIKYLKQAAENGKQVTVLVELKARFDEERNIMWAQRLEDSGVHVVYGVVGLKIHCKLLMIVRREKNKLIKYVHLSTGNYNSSTAKYYTDLSLFTKDTDITEDVAKLFNVMTSFAKIPKFKRLSVAPVYLRDEVIQNIEKETQIAKEGRRAYIFLKMNALVDPEVIMALYRASCAGVKVDLVIRGICCLKPGVRGLSENINVRSIVGRLLEHSRIYIFRADGADNVFLASADCMPRNFFKRIEVMFPVLQVENKKRILRIISIILKDNVKARILGSDGKYTKLHPGDHSPIDSQLELLKI
jgi:polyphosphate kinase